MNVISKVLIVVLTFSISSAQNHGFVELTKINSNIILDIRYATENNFLKRAVYPEPRCFVLSEVAVRLDSIQKELETIDLGLNQ